MGWLARNTYQDNRGQQRAHDLYHTPYCAAGIGCAMGFAEWH